VSADSGGLSAFSVDLLPYTSGGTFTNRANGVVMEDTATGEQLNLGFTTGRIQDVAAGRLSGSADFSAGSAMKPVYGIGQTTGNLNNLIPPNFDSQVATFGAGRINYGIETYLGKNFFLLARGTWTGATEPDFDRLSADSSASVYVNDTSAQSATATIEYQYRYLIFIEKFEFFDIVSSVPGSSINRAVGGAIAVSGFNNAYVSEVDQLLSDANQGHAPIQTIGPEASTSAIYVMAKLTGTPAQIDAFLTDPGITADVKANDPQFAPLHAAYDSQFGPGGFNALFKFANPGAASRIISWDTGTTGVTVDKLAVVPEPGMLAGITMGIVLFLRRGRGCGHFMAGSLSNRLRYG
jgi:hypothetical protein